MDKVSVDIQLTAMTSAAMLRDKLIVAWVELLGAAGIPSDHGAAIPEECWPSGIPSGRRLVLGR